MVGLFDILFFNCEYILSIHPFYEEENFLLDIKLVLKQEDGRSEAKRFENIVMKQMDEIKMLKKRCAELEGGNVRRRIKGKQFVSEKCDNIVEDEENVDKTKEVTFELADDAASNFDDFVDVVVQEVIFDMAKENKELEGSRSLNALIDEMEFGTEINALNHNSDDVLKEENNNVLGSDSVNRSGDESNGGTVDGTLEVEKRTVFQSSTVDNVRTRADCVKKKKRVYVFDPA
ncbi:uncharacterized protein [Primulina eburnea]|uniref:uncharacterized protein n=1 Tax=Primulina eburnea TaxID=1245227 RepID=UPI003C6C7EB8